MPEDARMEPELLLFFTLARPLACACPRRTLRLVQSVNSPLVSQGRGACYAAFICPNARSNTAKPESQPERPSTKPLAWLRMLASPS